METIYILNQALEKIGVVDNYKSMIWAKRYIDFGDCEIYCPATPENLSIFQLDNYIIREKDDMICRIDSVELETNIETGNFLIVTGSDTKKILNQRIVWKQTSFTGQAGEFIKRLINQNVISPTDNSRKINNFILGSFSGFTDSIKMQTTYDVLGDKIAEICRMFEYGSKVTFNGEKFVFDLYKGVDRSYNQSANPYVVFSNNFDNLKFSKFLTDKKNYATIALIGGEGEGNARVMTTANTSNDTGINRYEVFVDAKSTSTKINYEDLLESYPNGSINTSGGVVYYSVSNERIAKLDSATDPKNAELLPNPYYDLLNEAGREKLSEMKTFTNFEGEIETNNTYVYKTDYYLGDIIQLNDEFNNSYAVRIVEVVESFDEQGYSLIPTFEYKEA